MKNYSIKLASATIIYIGFAIYLYYPYLKYFSNWQYLFILNLCLAALGSYILSQRWLAYFWTSVFAGVIYGFCPFTLGLANYHPAAGLLAAVVPWFFLPAAFAGRLKWKWLSWPLCALPFLAVVGFFELTSLIHFFAIPSQIKLEIADLGYMFFPMIAANRARVLTGFYHLPTASLFMGFVMLFAARRVGIIVVLCLGLVLAIGGISFLNISSIIWLAIPVLCCSILIGAGLEGLVSAGRSDRFWVLGAFVIMTALCLVSFQLSVRYASILADLTGVNYSVLLADTGKIYLAGAILTAGVFIFAQTNLRLRVFRIILICGAMAADIFWSAGYIVDKIF